MCELGLCILKIDLVGHVVNVKRFFNKVACSPPPSQTEHKKSEAKHLANIECMRKTIATLIKERADRQATHQAAETVIKDISL